MMKILLIFFLTSSFLLGQVNTQFPVNDNYISSKLIRGVPASLKNNNYFSPPANTFYAIIYKNNSDSLYFISQKITAGSNKYTLVLTSNNKIVEYDYLNFTKISNDTLYATSSINLPEDKILTLRYLTKDNIIYFKVINKDIIENINSSTNDNKFKLGFDFEANQIRVSDKYNTSLLGSNSIPISFHTFLSFELNQNLSCKAKVGRYLITEFAGWEFGISWKYKLYKPLYISGGILQHSNEEDYYSNSEGTTSASILMLELGVGVDIVSFMSIELSYYLPTSKKIIGGHRILNKSSEFEYLPITFKHMIRLGFIFDWEL